MNNQQNLLVWYQENKRDLPWRNTQNPYHIWISEVILQQTRVAQGLPYFLRFMEKFPDVFSMANAPEDEILKLWQGLGYYSRARNMHSSAKLIAEVHQGVFPNTFNQLVKLKGIGPYTAAAIASFAFKEPVAVVDGNVARVLSRFYALETAFQTPAGKKLFSDLAQEFLNKSEPDIHNQAIMELGALVCTPTNPNCLVCPLQSNCLAFIQQKQSQFPVRITKNPPKKRYIAYFHFESNGKTALFKRPKGGIWQHLYDFPYLESEFPLTDEDWFSQAHLKNWFEPKQAVTKVLEKKHVLSHQHLYASFYLVQTEKIKELQFGEFWKANEELHQLGIPRLLDSYFEKLKEIYPELIS